MNRLRGTRCGRRIFAFVFALAVSAAAMAAPAGAATIRAGNHAADAAVLPNLEKTYPGASQEFVDCAIPQEMEEGPNEEEPGGPGYECESRVEVKGTVVKGRDEVLEYPEHKHHYLLEFERVTSTAPDAWHRCGFGRGAIPKVSDLKVLVRGSDCGGSTKRVFEEVASFAYRYANRTDRYVDRLLPSSFSVGDREEEAGFVVDRYECRASHGSVGRTRLYQSADCTTRFGDGFKVKFDEPQPLTGHAR